MVGTKRASTGRETRSKKAKLDSDAESNGNGNTGEPDSKGVKKTKNGKAKTKPAAPKDFTARALPLHFNVSHVPPAIDTESTAPSASDPGVIAHVSALPAIFSTGSVGWKGSKRLTIELEGDGADGEKETVQVMLSINATVLGSKPPKETKDIKETVDADADTDEKDDAKADDED